MLLNVISVIIADLALSIDNAIIMGAIIRSVAPQHRIVVAILAVIGMTTARITATASLGWILQLPGASLIGGIIIGGLAIRFIRGMRTSAEHTVDTSRIPMSASGAVMLIIWDDLMNSIDNMAAVSGVAGGDILSIIIGLSISMSILGLVASIAAQILTRFTWASWIGAGALIVASTRMLLIGGSELVNLL